MTAVLEDDRVHLRDEAEASRVHNKGWYGTPVSGGGLRLDLVEAAFLLELDRIEIEGTDFTDLLVRGSDLRDDFEIRYLVYRDLRRRGFVTEVEDGAFLIYPRGDAPKEAEPQARVRPCSERSAFVWEKIHADRAQAGDAGRTLLYALVDEEGDLTYYRIEPLDLPDGEAPDDRPVHGRAVMLGDRALVADPDLAARLHEDGFYGRLVNDRLQLSLVEVAHLQDRGLSVVDGEGEPVGPATLRDRAAAVQDDFPLRLKAYRSLREAGLVPKTGFKYGAHFRLYTGSPDETHAGYLVQVLPAGFEGPWPEIAGFVRLAHSVRKTLALLSFDDGRPTVLTLQRARP